MAEKRKLTLSVDGEVVRRAKELARRWGTSVSGLVEEGLRGLTDREPGESSVVARLRGILPEDVDREAHRRHLEGKHGG